MPRLKGTAFFLTALLLLFYPLSSFAVTATITGAPSGLTNHTNPVIVIGGDGVVSYSYKLDNGNWSSEVTVGTNIIFSADTNIFGLALSAGSSNLQTFLDDRTDYIDSVTFDNVAVDTPIIFLLNPIRIGLDSENTLNIQGSNVDGISAQMNNASVGNGTTDLLSFSVSGGKLTQTTGTEAFILQVPTTTSAVVVAPTATNAEASITVNGVGVVSSAQSAPVAVSDGSVITIVTSYTDPTTQVVASQTYTITVSVNSSLPSTDEYISYYLKTDTPQTDYVRIINGGVSTASVKLNLDDELFTSEADVLDEILAMTPEYDGEPVERKVWRFIRDNRYHWYPPSTDFWESSSPALFFNSMGFGFCGDSAALYCQIMTSLGYQTRFWQLYGHAVSEVLINGRWELYDADEQVYYIDSEGQVAGVEELAANPALITNPIDPLSCALGGAVGAYSQYIADIYATTSNNYEEPWSSYYDPTVSNYLLNLQIPAGGSLEFPSVFAAPMHTSFFSEAPSYTNARLVVPAGWTGSLTTPFVIESIGYEGPHTLSVIGKDSYGNWQTTPTVATWQTDSWAPITTPHLNSLLNQVTLTTNKPAPNEPATNTATIYYTTDGTYPTLGSTVYSSPINVDSSTVLQFFAVDSLGNIETVKYYDPSTGNVYAISAPPATGVTLTADKPSPQLAGTVVTLTGFATGGSGVYEYYFNYRDPVTGVWSVGRDYREDPSWTWNTMGMNAGTYYIQVWARSTGSTAPYDVYSQIAFTINPFPATAITITTDNPSPQVVGNTITVTGSASGGSGSYQYYFAYRDPVTGQWLAGQQYSTNPSWVWNTGGMNTGTYYVQVWAKSTDSPALYDVIGQIAYTINPPGYAINSSVSSGSGSISCDPSTVPQGEGSICTITPEPNSYLQGLTDNGVDVTSSVSNSQYSLTNVNSTHTINATFATYPVMMTIDQGSSYYLTPQDAYDASSGGDMIQLQALNFTQDLLFNLNGAVTLNGGYQPDFSAQSGYTTIQGSLTIAGGPVTVSNLIIQ